jgi:hypothetical protein
MSDEAREGIERRADITRYKLLRTLQALDRKRHQILDVKQNVQKHVTGVLIASLSVAFTLGGAIALLALRAAHSGERRRLERWAALVRAFRHPDRIARASDSLAPAAFKNVVRVLLTTVAAEVAKLVVKRVLLAPRQRDVAFDAKAR